MRLGRVFAAALLATGLGAGIAAYGSGEPAPILPFDAGPPGSGAEWLVSHWPAGQTGLATWRRGNVRPAEDGSALELILSRAPDAVPAPDDAGTDDEAEDGDDRPWHAAEFQSNRVARTGTWSWTATAPRMVDGAVFGMFLYRADHDDDPWREYDFEFVGGTTTEIQLNIHFEDAEGRHVTLEGGPKIVDLGFDAAEGPHTYEIEVSETRAIFRIDGKVVGDFTAADMERGVWDPGPLRSIVDVWPVSKAQHGWAGVWRDPGRPLVARIHAASLPADARLP